MSGLKARLSTDVVRFISVFSGDADAGSIGWPLPRSSPCCLNTHATPSPK